MPIRIPTHFMPPTDVHLADITLSPGPAARLYFDNGSMHLTRSIILPPEISRGMAIDWLFFHSLISNSVEPLEYFDNPHLYEFKDLSQEEIDKYLNKETTDFDSIINQAYNVNVPEKISYFDAYDRYKALDEATKNEIRNYFGAESLSTGKLKSVDMSYWQISVYVSIIEVLLGAPPECPNDSIVCPDCGKTWGAHHKDGIGTWLQSELYDKVKSDRIRTQYKKIIDTARNRIRHKSIHEGLIPTAQTVQRPDGPFSFDAPRSIKGFKADKLALLSVVKHLQEITRFMLLNKVTGFEIFPELRGVYGHSITTDLSKHAKKLGISPVKNNS